MSELSKDELLGRLQIMLVRARANLFQREPSQYAKPMEKNLEQAYKQIKEMIQKPGVTEEWMEEIKSRPISMKKFKKLCEAFSRFAEKTGVKITITMEREEIHGRK